MLTLCRGIGPVKSARLYPSVSGGIVLELGRLRIGKRHENGDPVRDCNSGEIRDAFGQSDIVIVGPKKDGTRRKGALSARSECKSPGMQVRQPRRQNEHSD